MQSALPIGYFRYGEQQLSHLKAADPILSEQIDKIGFIRRETDPDFFRCAAFTIIGQQISSQAQQTVFSRLCKSFDLTPGSIARANESELKSAGMSAKKARCIKSLAQSIITGGLDINALKTLSDEEVIKTLCRFDGIGRWTAEMLLIFCFERQNVFSFGDFGIRRGLKILHGEPLSDKELFLKYRSLYSPYCTLASFYLWEISAQT